MYFSFGEVGGGGFTYKTKGTVLVFSWCGSGLMPQNHEKIEREGRNTVMTSSVVPTVVGTDPLRRIFIRVAYTQL